MVHIKFTSFATCVMLHETPGLPPLSMTLLVRCITFAYHLICKALCSAWAFLYLLFYSGGSVPLRALAHIPVASVATTRPKIVISDFTASFSESLVV